MSQCHMRYTIKGQSPVVLPAVVAFPVTIGRLGECDVTIPDPSISSCHAQLVERDGGEVWLVDNGSTNGIYLNYRRVPEVPVRGRTEVIMGTVRVELSPEPLPEGAPMSAPSPARPLASSAPAGSPAATLARLSSASSRGEIICPHCWHRFTVDEFLFIARHQSLVGDPVLGADAAQRFLPSRFTPEGNALDAAGVSCPDMACPRCHLRIPQAASEMPPLFLSIVGATASGKSYLLTSMTWVLRNVLPQDFAISFTDTDAVNNQILNDFEETIFLHPDADELVALSKTELQGELYNQVLLDNMLINLPKPFMFTVMPAEHHPRYEEVRSTMSRTLVLYDNAGEHFEPGMDSVDNPTTQHLLHSDTIFFLFDPTKDVRLRKRLADVDDPQLEAGARVQRQEIILTEMINRIKKYSGLKASRKSAKTLLFLVSKFDVWRHLLPGGGADIPDEPWQWDIEQNTSVLDIDLIKNLSFQVRQLLEETCPEVVSTAESFAGDVLYLPNSALGHSPELSDETGMIGIRPADVHPWWVEVPMLYFLWERGFIPSVAEEQRVHHLCVDAVCRRSGDIFFVSLPGRRKPLQVPVSFAGYELNVPGTDDWFRVPELEA